MPNASTLARAGGNVRNRENNRRIADHYMNACKQDHFIRDFRSESGKTQVQWELKNPCRQFRSPGIEVPHAVRAGMPV
ncbi:PhzA/PhzB family protein [Streptomyces niveus]|uniref:PhzA/PhzB family protein n=1 Tax=Streptomyces niveus TaxID=193462 RepID=UPI0036C0A697